ncbi:MAG: hypothetical protein ACOCVN_02670 [bacterium]
MKYLILIMVSFQYGFILAQEMNIPEPEFINSVIYVNKENDETAKLEKAIPSNMSKNSTVSVLVGGYGKDNFLRIDGKNSPVQLPVKSSYDFIVRMMSNEFDPAGEIAIVKMKQKRKNREIKVSEEKLFGRQSYDELDYIPIPLLNMAKALI